MKALTSAFLLGLALIFWALRLLHSSMMVEWPQRMMDGTGETPFQYRDLVPLLCHGVQLVWPSLPPVAAFLAIDGAVAIALFFLMLSVLHEFGLGRGWIAGFFLILIVNYAGPFGNFIWWFDLPSMALFALGLILLHREERVGFYAILAIGMLNRETAILLSVAFCAVEFGRMSWPCLTGHALAQATLILAIKAGLYLAFRHNEGYGLASAWETETAQPGSAGSRAWMNLLWLTGHDVEFSHGSPFLLFAGFWLPLIMVLPKIGDRFIRRLQWLIPLDLAAMIVVGNLWEARIFNELVPVILLGAASGIETVFRTPRPVPADPLGQTDRG